MAHFAAEVAIEQGDFERFYNGARLVPACQLRC